MAAKPTRACHQVFDCPICKEAFIDPRITDCGHTFCLGCLRQHVVYSSATSLDRECPICKKRLKIPKGGVEKLPINFLAIQAESAVEEAGSAVEAAVSAVEEVGDDMTTHSECGACRTRATAGVFCKSCQDYLCHRCGKKHQEVFTSHDVTRNMGNIPTAKCKIHHGKTISYFCSHCNAGVCPLCATCSHSYAPHRVTPLEEAKNEFVELVKGKILSLKNTKKNLSEEQDTLDRIRQSAVGNYALQKGIVDSTADDAVRRIREKQQELQNRIQNLHDNNIMTLDQHDRLTEEKSSLLDATLTQVESAVQLITVSDFHHRSHEVELMLKKIDDFSWAPDTAFPIHEYTFNREANCIELGDIALPERGSLTDIDLLKSHVYNDGEDGVREDGAREDGAREDGAREDGAREDGAREDGAREDGAREGVVERRRRPEQPEPLPAPMVMKDQTERKGYIGGSPALLSSYVLESGVDSIPIKMIGLGLMPNDDVVYAYNTNNMGQVVMCSSVDKHQVVYHRRKGIAAFAMYRDHECGVVLEDDCNVSRLFLKDVPSEREASCRTHKISCRAANIGALAFHLDGVMVLFDKDKTCLTGIDRQSKRPFNLQGNRNEESGRFSTVTDLASGPQGEIILYDGEKRRLAIFSSDTKFLNYIDLSCLSSSCSIDCDDYGMLFIADRKQGKIVRCRISGRDDIVEVLNTTHGITSPCCVCVSQSKLAVGNAKSFNEGEIRVFELAVSNG